MHFLDPFPHQKPLHWQQLWAALWQATLSGGPASNGRLDKGLGMKAQYPHCSVTA